MAVNPHAETYQGKTQFSGPVKAGTRWNGPNSVYEQTRVSTNPIAVNKLANAGYVVCSQSCAVDQTADAGIMKSAPCITIPAGSVTVSMELIATAAWDGTNTIQVVVRQDDGGNQSMTSATAIAAVGVYNLSPDSLQRTSRWKNINYDGGIADNLSVDVGYLGVTAGTGRGILTINYVPGLNL